MCLTEHCLDDRGRLLGLPGAVCLLSRLWPFNVHVHPRPERSGASEHGDCRLKNPAPHLALARHSERMSKRKFNSDNSRSPEAFSDGGHHRHDDGRHTGCFDPTRQHGHVLAAVRSYRCQDNAVGAMIVQPGGDFRGGPLPPHVQTLLLEAHYGYMFWSYGPDETFIDKVT